MNTSRILTLRLLDQSRQLGYWFLFPSLCHQDELVASINNSLGGAWQAAVHGVAKSRTRLNDFTSTFHFHALEKEMATHSSVLALRIPGMGETGGLPSMGRTGSDVTEVTQQQRQCVSINPKLLIYPLPFFPFGNQEFVFCKTQIILELNLSPRS